MFSPIKTPEPARTLNPTHNKNNSSNDTPARTGSRSDIDAAVRALRSPISVGSLSVRRLRAIVSEHGGKSVSDLVEQRDPVMMIGMKSMSSVNDNNNQSRNDSASRLHLAQSPFLLKQRKMLEKQQRQQTQSQRAIDDEKDDEAGDVDDCAIDEEEIQRRQDEEEIVSMARDLSALMGGAPVPRFITMMSPSRMNLHKQEEEASAERERRRQQEEEKQEIIEEQRIRKQARQAAVKSNEDNSKTHQQQHDAVLSHRHARFLDEELSLKLQHLKHVQQQTQQRQLGNHSNTKHDTSSSNSSVVTLPVAMHCRELGFRLAERMGPAYGPLLHRIIELLATFAQEQQSAAHKAEHELKCFKDNHNMISDLAPDQDDSRRRRSHHHHHQHSQQQNLAASIGGSGSGTFFEASFLAAGTAASSPAHSHNHHHRQYQAYLNTAASPSASVVANDPHAAALFDPEAIFDADAERKRLLAEVVTLKGELATEHEKMQNVVKSKQDLQTMLDDQFVLQNRRDEETRELNRTATERYDELERAYREKCSECKDLKLEIKCLQNDLEEKLWVANIEVESTAVREQLLRKHCKDTEARAAVSAMRLRQEQELVMKLRRKLTELVENLDDILEEYLDGNVPAAQTTTPRPDKDAIVKAVPQLGKAQASASTASMVASLVSIVTSLEERLKVEERSWEQAQAEADRILEQRRGRRFEDAAVQTEATK